MHERGHELHVGERAAAARVVVEGAAAREPHQQQLQVVHRARVPDVAVARALLHATQPILNLLYTSR